MESLLSYNWPTIFVCSAGGAAILSVAGLIYVKYFYVDYPKIKGIPEIPGGELLAGHLYQLGIDHATTAEKWAAQYGWPIFQVRMGYRRAIMINSFEGARDFFVRNQSATSDRPWFYTFHGVVSATSAATIGTNPWNERTKKQRRVVGSFTTAPSIQRLRPELDLETCAVISALYYDSQKGATDIMPHIYQKRLALNLMMMFSYGKRFNTVTDPLFLQILSDANTIASFRSTVSNPQDFVPHLRYLSSNDRVGVAKVVRDRRDKWLAAMLDEAKENVNEKTTDKKTVAEMLLTDNTEGLTKMDVKTILGGLMSGGFETILSTLSIAIGVLASPEGHSIQEEAYKDIMSVYDSPEEAFESAPAEEKSAYIQALVKEALRVYPPLKLLPARQTYRDMEYQGSRIPKGVLLYVNTQAANRDPATFGPDADKFRPSRWLDSAHEIPPPYHFGFGAGARMCTAVNFANRVLYTMLLRLIISFKFDESKEGRIDTDYISYKEDPRASNAMPSDFKVKLTPRDTGIVELCLKQTQESSFRAMPDFRHEPLVR